MLQFDRTVAYKFSMLLDYSQLHLPLISCAVLCNTALQHRIGDYSWTKEICECYSHFEKLAVLLADEPPR